MTGHIDALADELTALIRSRDLPGAARVLRRLEFEIARELDRVNAPRSRIVASPPVRR